MQTTRSDRRRWRRVVVAVALACSLAGCSDDDPAAPEPAPRDRKADEPTPARAAPDVVAELRRTLRERAAAVRAGDRAAFLAGVDADDSAFARDQATYFANLEQLPVGRFGYDLDRTSLVRQGRGYWLTVDVTLELEGFDAVPVVTRDRYLLTPRRGDRFAVASVSDPAWEQASDLSPQPWDLGPVTVRYGNGVLAVFDAGGTAAAAGIVADVEAGVAAVAAEVPSAWDRRVVVYALDDPGFLAGLRDLPVSDPLTLDAVTFPVPARPGGARVASTRFVLNPAMVTAPGPSRDRLIRHELTHVALAEDLDGVPTWLSEGLAEYVSVRPMAPEERALSAAALSEAESGITAMPDDDDFRDATEVSYGIAWWACEYVAETYDESVLWLLLDVMRGAEDPDEALRSVLRVDQDELARKAGRLMLDTYRPEPPEESPLPSDEPSGSPEGEESPSPDDDRSGSSSESPSASGSPSAQQSS